MEFGGMSLSHREEPGVGSWSREEPEVQLQGAWD